MATVAGGVYAEAAGFQAALVPVLPACWNPRAGLHHYVGLMRRGVTDDLTGEEIRLKRLFYALRSTLAARWIQQRPTEVSPMEFSVLRALLPPERNGIVDELLVPKATADEKTTVPRPTTLVDHYVSARHYGRKHVQRTVPG